MSIGSRIRDARTQAGLTQTQVGRLLSRQRTHAAISELEHGKVRPKATELIELSALLGKTVSWFLEGDPGEALIRASVRYFDCLCEFDEHPECCAELADAWDDAVIVYKQAMGQLARTEAA